MPRNKHGQQKGKYLAYQKGQRKPHKLTQGRIRSLVYLLERFLGQFDAMLNGLPPQVGPPRIIWECKATIEEVLGQQQEWHTTKERPEDLIPSMDKGHIRPVARGKETKRVEFRTKVNTLQVDGIDFIEHLIPNHI